MDQPGVMAEIASIFASHQVSLASVTQKEVPEKAERASLIITTHSTTEEAIQRAVADLGCLATLEEDPFCMPIGTIS